MEDLEVNLDGAEKLAQSGSQIRVLMDHFGDIDLVREVFKKGDKVEEMDFGEARILVMKLGETQDIMDLAKKFENCVIICPHGNTSLRVANALKNMGIHAYSLKGGLAGLRSR